MSSIPWRCPIAGTLLKSSGSAGTSPFTSQEPNNPRLPVTGAAVFSSDIGAQSVVRTPSEVGGPSPDTISALSDLYLRKAISKEQVP